MPGHLFCDQDGQSNGDELITVTNPNRAEDLFRIGSVRWTDAGVPLLSWNAVTGRHYDVTFRDDLGSADEEFFPVPGLSDVVAGADGPLEVPDVSAEGDRTRYYRISARLR